MEKNHDASSHSQHVIKSTMFGDISQNPSPPDSHLHRRRTSQNRKKNNRVITVSNVVVSDGCRLASGIGLVIPGDVVFASASYTWSVVGSLDSFLAGAHAIDGADALYFARRD